MAPKRLKLSPKAALPFKSANKQKRQDLFIKQKKARESGKREERFRRRKEEDKNPRLRAERQRLNEPSTLDRKRVWDDFDSDNEVGLGMSIDLDRLKRQKSESEAVGASTPLTAAEDAAKGSNDDHDSMIDSSSGSEEDESQTDRRNTKTLQPVKERAISPPRSTASTNLDLMPEALAAKFPSLFAQEHRTPKILVTTSINSNLHEEANILASMFPNGVYIPRSAHRYGHKYSIREISKFAQNRNYTGIVVLNEDQKRPHGIDIVNLPDGPMFHFSITNWVEGKKLPGHGNPSSHYPELILNNFRTPLGHLVARLFFRLFPPKPEFEGRQVVTLHNQRDWIFVRRHRYVFRDKRETEKPVVGADGKQLAGAEGIRAGLQELGPRFTMKLRRIDKGIQRSSGQEWEWKGKTDRIRTKFQL